MAVRIHARRWNWLSHHAVRAKVRASANQLRHGSQRLERLIRDEGLLVAGAEYSLETGAVDFFDGMREGAAATHIDQHLR